MPVQGYKPSGALQGKAAHCSPEAALHVTPAPNRFMLLSQLMPVGEQADQNSARANRLSTPGGTTGCDRQAMLSIQLNAAKSAISRRGALDYVTIAVPTGKNKGVGLTGTVSHFPDCERPWLQTEGEL